jgi:hypothetical protein
MTGARGREHRCQEASPLSRGSYIACNAPAVTVIDNGDPQPYWMCAACADHNVRNRGAVRFVPATMAETEADCSETEADRAEERELAEHNEWKASKR